MFEKFENTKYLTNFSPCLAVAILLFVFLGRDATMTGVHRMHAPTPITTTAFATLRANSVPSSPMPARPASVMATVSAPALESKGSPTTMQTTICTMVNPLEMPIMITRGGLMMWHQVYQTTTPLLLQRRRRQQHQRMHQHQPRRRIQPRSQAIYRRRHRS